MKKIREKFKSVRARLFFTLCTVIIIVILFLILINNIVLETFYLYSKTNTIKSLYEKINSYYHNPDNAINLEEELKNIAIRNNIDILIKQNNDMIIVTTDKEFMGNIGKISISNIFNGKNKSGDILYARDKMIIKQLQDEKNNIKYIVLFATLDNDYNLYIRIPISAIEESVQISNNLLLFIGGIVIVISGILASFISRKFTKPILELNNIANKMAKLDFSQKYRIKDTEDEINDLGKSINTMSDKLETTIKQLRGTNIELEKDIEEKSKIDEMRKQFISDVSHELKTPIALIQGYAEGLVENVNSDEESRRFYAEVILDETNKMDILVKQLLELMKLEYGKREFNNKKFDLKELINEVIRRCNVMIEENTINIKLNSDEGLCVYADDFYIEQVITNYLTNAIKHAKEVNGEKKIVINAKVNEKTNKVKVSVYNTGDNINQEDLDRIWGRFYKIDSSRNRNNGGSGIGLALVKAIMNNYKNSYGVENKAGGVEFFFEMDLCENL
ncbi:MAG: HAMP domain-containing protein [Clostridia bacterium]|nr:HAMP domain-containing protein [Clostridia bacterium]